MGDPLARDVIKDLEGAIREENEGGKAGWLECFRTRSMSEFLAFSVLSTALRSTISVEENSERLHGTILAATQWTVSLITLPTSIHVLMYRS